MRLDDLYLSDEDIDMSQPFCGELMDSYYTGGTDWRTPDHMRSMRQAWLRQSTPAQRSKIAAHAGKARRKSASVPCPRCGAESSYNGRPRRICAKGHTFTEASCKSR